MDALAIGVTLGIATLFVAQAAILLPVSVGWLIWDTRGQLADRIPALTLLLIGFAVPVAIGWSNGF